MFSNDLLTSAELPMAAIPITAGAFTKQKITIGPIDIPAPGYVYIYVNDNSNSPNWVHFDDLKITHVHSPFVSGADYYPFGLTMSDREILTEPYRFGYQGQYAEEETETGWNSFDLRMYDARFGRWLSPDPYIQYSSGYMAMGNSPSSNVDADGGWSWITAGVGFAIGATAGYVASDGDWRYALAGGLAGGVLGGVSFNQDHLGGVKYNGGYREYGGLRIEFNTKLFRNLSFDPPAYFNLLILHDPWNPSIATWGKLDGHVFIDDNGVDYSFRPTNIRNGKKLDHTGLLGENDFLWHSDGSVGSDPKYAGSTRNAENLIGGYSHSELRIKTTTAKKKALLDNIHKAALDPPDYSFIGKRCAGFAMKMMRQSKIVPLTSKLHQFTPRLLENYMLRRPGVTRLFP